MAKTNLPSKQLELPIMVDLAGRPERRSAGAVATLAEASNRHTSPRKEATEATPLDLSVYDAISANYQRGAK